LNGLKNDASYEFIGEIILNVNVIFSGGAKEGLGGLQPPCRGSLKLIDSSGKTEKKI
jgi:hypothetical protein